MPNFNPTITVIAGMGTVFSVLTIMVFVIWISKHFIGDKNAAVPAPPADEPKAPKQVAGTDGALVAAITAAISVATGRSASTFRIAAIEPSSGGFNTPVWGHVNRLSGYQGRK